MAGELSGRVPYRMSSGPGSNVCRRCKVKVVNAIKCILCGNAFHLSCAKLNNDVENIDSETFKCCDSIIDKEGSAFETCVNQEDSTLCDVLEQYANDDGKVDIHLIKYLLNQKEYVIKQKDEIICELRDKITILKKHIEVIDKTHHDTLNDSFKNSLKSAETTLNKTVSNVLNKTVDNKISLKSGNIANQQVSENFKNPSPTEHKDQTSDLWSTVVKRKNNIRHTVIGNKTNIGASAVKIQGVPRVTSLHVYRMIPSTTTGQLEEFLKPNLSILKCEKLNSRNPDIYSSFKIDILEEQLEYALNPGHYQ